MHNAKGSGNWGERLSFESDPSCDLVVAIEALRQNVPYFSVDRPVVGRILESGL